MGRGEFMAFLGSAAAALLLTASAQQPAPPSPVRQDWLDRRKEPALEPELPIVETRITLEIDFASAGRR